MKTIAKPENKEHGNGGGELETQELPVGRPLLWTPLFWRAGGCPPYPYLSAIRAICSGGHGGEHLSNVIRDSGINYQRLDFIVRNSEMVVERDRAAGK